MSMARFVVGAIVGAASALMLAPKTGAETRATLAEWLAEAGEATKHATEAGRDNLYERVREVNEDAADILEDAVDSATAKASDAADDIREKINEARDRLAQQAAEFAAASAGEPVDAHVVSVSDVEPEPEAE